MALIPVSIVIERAGILWSEGGDISKFFGLLLALLGCATLFLGAHEFRRTRG